MSVVPRSSTHAIIGKFPPRETTTKKTESHFQSRENGEWSDWLRSKRAKCPQRLLPLADWRRLLVLLGWVSSDSLVAWWRWVVSPPPPEVRLCPETALHCTPPTQIVAIARHSLGWSCKLNFLEFLTLLREIYQCLPTRARDTDVSCLVIGYSSLHRIQFGFETRVTSSLFQFRLQQCRAGTNWILETGMTRVIKDSSHHLMTLDSVSLLKNLRQFSSVNHNLLISHMNDHNHTTVLRG